MAAAANDNATKGSRAAPSYEEEVHAQIDSAIASKGEGDLMALLRSGDTWTVE